MSQFRRDDPTLDTLDLPAHAKAVIRGDVELDPEAREAMSRVVGIVPDPSALDVVIARAFLAVISGVK